MNKILQALMAHQELYIYIYIYKICLKILNCFYIKDFIKIRKMQEWKWQTKYTQTGVEFITAPCTLAYINSCNKYSIQCCEEIPGTDRFCKVQETEEPHHHKTLGSQITVTLLIPRSSGQLSKKGKPTIPSLSNGPATACSTDSYIQRRNAW